MIKTSLKKITAFLVFAFFTVIFTYSQQLVSDSEITPYVPENFEALPPAVPPEGLFTLKKAYPDVSFISIYDEEIKDFKITVKTPDREPAEFYWCNGSMLPYEELKNKDKYWTLLYRYDNELKDPAAFTEEEKEQLKNFASKSNRRNGSGTPMFFFDYLYHSESQAKIEQHIKRIEFLGHGTRVHERIIKPLKNVEKKILALSETDDEVKTFVSKIKSSDAYYWRQIDGTSRKSFHSLGIAVDILPVRITGEIYWSWARDKNPDGWMLTPLSRRWMPPKKVIDIFEEEGFIWGGNWVIWDNMHFEYHPELIVK